jgi:UDPglucose 6-dehydrogenase
MNEVRHRIGDTITYCKDLYDAVVDADAVMLVTEWKEFRLPTWRVVAKVMKTPVVIDGRNIYDPQEMAENGFTYYSIGRKPIIR